MRDSGAGSLPVHFSGGLEVAREHCDEDRRQPVPPAGGDAGVRCLEQLDAPDRLDAGDDRRDAAAAQGRRDPRGGRRAGRPDSTGARPDGGRGADRPAQVQHRAAHERLARARLHRDPAARSRDQPADPAPDRGHDPAGGQPRVVCPQGGERCDRLRGCDRQELCLPGYHQRPALHRRGRGFPQLAHGAPDHPRHGDRHAQRRESAAQSIR